MTYSRCTTKPLCLPVLIIVLGLFSACSDSNQTAQSIDVNQYIKEGKQQEAIAILSEALIAHPRDPNLLYNLAIIQRQQGKTEDARRNLAKAYSFASNDDNINLLLAELTLETGDEQEAWDQFVRISETGKQTSRAQFIKGIIHSRMGDYQQAEPAFQAAISLGDTNAMTKAALAFVYAKQGRLEEAGRLLQETEAQPNLSPDEKRQIAEGYLAVGNAKRAQEIASELQQQRPDDARILTLLGKAEMTLLRFGEAESALTRALSSPNATPWTKVAYAEMLFAAQREEEALAKAQEAEEELELNYPSVRDPSLYNLLATLYARKGQVLLSRKYLTKSLQAQPLQPKVAELIQKIDRQ